MRKLLLLVPAALALMVAQAPSAEACEAVGRPVVLDPPRDTVAQLREEAARLDSEATRDERSAGALEREAEVLFAEARALRLDAQRVSEIARRELLQLAEETSTRGAWSQRRARELRASAGDLRSQARLLRERANRLAGGGGGGWRGRPVPPRSVAFGDPA